MKKLLFTLALGLSATSTCQADAILGDFTILNGSPSASGGQVTFSLNPDGTISAALSTTGGALIRGFGFDSIGVNITESNFAPTTPDNTYGFLDTYGSHHSGFYCLACGTSESWTIGNPGDFASVFDALGGGNSTYDFFFITQDNKQWAASAVTVPEPATLALLGFGLAGLATSRRRKQ